jgi:hypothetical protein
MNEEEVSYISEWLVKHALIIEITREQIGSMLITDNTLLQVMQRILSALKMLLYKIVRI